MNEWPSGKMEVVARDCNRDDRVFKGLIILPAIVIIDGAYSDISDI